MFSSLLKLIFLFIKHADTYFSHFAHLFRIFIRLHDYGVYSGSDKRTIVQMVIQAPNLAQ